MGSIQDVLNLSQKGTRLDPFVKMLKKLYSDRSHAEFMKEYCKLLKIPLGFSGQNSIVTRVLQITIKFAVQLNEESAKNDETDLMHPFLRDLIYFLIKVSKSAYYSIRARALSVLGKIFQQLTELNCEEKLLESLYKMASDRLRDISANVRAEAVTAVCFLQDPSSPSCPIFQDFLRLLSKDPWHITRRNIVEVIAITRQSINPIKERLRDIHPSVKKAALTRISEKMSIKCFSITNRIEILEMCYNDPILKDVMKNKLLPSWLKQDDGDIVKFLCRIDIQSSPKVIQECLFLLFEQDDLRSLATKLDLDPKLHVIPKERLNDETVFFWLSLCQYVKQQKSEFALDMFDELTPTLSNFCDYFEDFIVGLKDKDDDEKSVEHLFVLEQLLLLAEEMDFDDVYGVKRIKALLTEILFSSFCLIELIEPLIKCLRVVHTNEDEFLNHIAEISLELSACFVSADGTLNQPDLKKLIKGLRVVVCALKVTSMKNCAPQLIEMKDTILKPCMSHPNSNVRLAAIEALGLYSLHDIDEAQKNYLLLMHALHYDDLKVRVAVLKSAFDILLCFGAKFLASSSQEVLENRASDSTATVEEERLFFLFYERLLPFLHSEEKELRTIAVQGMGKLLLWGRLSSAQLFSQLFLMCYNPLYHDDADIMQFLTSFLPAYAAGSRLKKECLEDAFMITMETLLDAPETSNISDIDAYNVGVAFLQLSRLVPAASSKTGNRIHDHLAPRILNMILNDPKGPGVVTLARLLCHLELTGRRKEEMVEKVEAVLSEVKNRPAVRNLEKFHDKVNVLEPLNSSSFCVMDEDAELPSSEQGQPGSEHSTPKKETENDVQTTEVQDTSKRTPENENTNSDGPSSVYETPLGNEGSDTPAISQNSNMELLKENSPAYGQSSVYETPEKTESSDTPAVSQSSEIELQKENTSTDGRTSVCETPMETESSDTPAISQNSEVEPQEENINTDGPTSVCETPMETDDSDNPAISQSSEQEIKSIGSNLSRFSEEQKIDEKTGVSGVGISDSELASSDDVIAP